ncbi:uncharacterized protein RCC_02640 [Ramularia collo-cygni]|uniref:Glycosyl transferase CAP10 domain-containing protein n=1 Tax=Ramularia collo-cygni TaxID=112498 RepID=A0A2D3UZW1_9PEZI|nr:uncharacterized protein RCC_02640 [Ramularia collo-cygni]CZT16806.1 uncharacterized protein RCC_02640 [Ramularia collo-cygni]
MHPMVWKILSGALLVCVLVQQFGRSESAWRRPLFKSEVDDLSLQAECQNSPTGPPASTVSKWSYEWERDGNSHGLNTEQCNSAFPELFREVERATEYWKDRGVSESDIELFGGNHGGLRVLIHDQQVRVIRTRGLYRDDFRHRINAVLQQIQRAMTAAEWANEPFPDMEFSVVVDDIAILPKDKLSALWAFTRSYGKTAHDSLFVIPDFHFYAAPPEAEGYPAQQAKARKHDSPIEQKIPQVVWRGVEWTNRDIRRPLLEVTNGQPWADVVSMDWNDRKSVMSMEDFCKYRFAVNTEGRAWSARLTHLLNCDGVVLVHDVEWIAHYYHLLDTEIDSAEGANCIHVERDFSNLKAKVEYYNNHTDEAQEIATRARKMFRERYTSPAATSCYWRNLMRAWSSIAFEPAIMEKMKGGKEKMRGISFEEFSLHINNVDYPYQKEKRRADIGRLKTKAEQSLNKPELSTETGHTEV